MEALDTYRIELLGADAAASVRSILADAYADERTFMALFNSDKAGYEQRLRAFVRECVQAHLENHQSLMGLFHDDRLIGAAMLCAPGAHQSQTLSLKRKLAMISTVGLSGAQAYFKYQDQLQSHMPGDDWCFLPMVGVKHEQRRQGAGRALLQSAWEQSKRMTGSSGIALGSGAAKAADFYKSLGFTAVGQLDVNGTQETCFFKAS